MRFSVRPSGRTFLLLEAVKMKRIFSIILALVIVIGISGCSTSDDTYSDYEYEPEPIVEYDVKIHIDFTENLLFSKYNVYLSVGVEEEELTHGKDADFDFVLEEGTHTIYFTSVSDSSIETTKSIDVDCNMEVGYKISCHSDEIKVEELYVDKEKELTDTEIEIKFDKTEFTYENYEDVIKKLQEAGFTNIVKKPIYDIVWGFTEEGEVDNVTIGGSDTYKRGDIFENNVEVVVSYHLEETANPDKIFPPYDTGTASGKNYKEVVKAFEEKGFTNIKTVAKEESDIWGNKNDEVAYITVAGDTVNQFKDYSLDDEVVIGYYVIVESGPSKTELSAYYAQRAFEKYGKNLYPYGFKCHWVLDYIAEEKRTDGSYFLKVGVTITNMYGAEYKTVAEGIVSGTDANAKVTQFYVSQ